MMFLCPCYSPAHLPLDTNDREFQARKVHQSVKQEAQDGAAADVEVEEGKPKPTPEVVGTAPEPEKYEIKGPTFTVNIKKIKGKALGLVFDLDDGETAYVCSVREGPVKDYNDGLPQEAEEAEQRHRLQAGDYIVGVNGTCGDAQRIFRRIQQDDELEFRVKHPEYIHTVIYNSAADKDKLGVRTRYAPHGLSMLICSDVMEGQFQKWNEANEERAVRKHDRIVSVNGVEADGSVRPLVDALQQEGQLNVKISRPAGVHSLTATQTTVSKENTNDGVLNPGMESWVGTHQREDTGSPQHGEAAIAQIMANEAQMHDEVDLPHNEAQDAPADDAEASRRAEAGAAAAARAEAERRQAEEEAARVQAAEEAEAARKAEEEARQKDFDDKVNQLVGMGFTADAASSALLETDGNFDAALEQLTPAAGEAPPSGSTAVPREEPAEEDFDDKVNELVAMGFTAEAARAALIDKEGNIETAAEQLMRGAAEAPPSGGDAASPQEGGAANAGDIAQLVGMGISEDRAREALAASGGDLNAALEGLVNEAADGGGEPGGGTAADGGEVKGEDVAQLVEMGYTPEQADKALKAAGGNLGQAMEALMGDA